MKKYEVFSAVKQIQAIVDSEDYLMSLKKQKIALQGSEKCHLVI